jgi:hypothetical protein
MNRTSCQVGGSRLVVVVLVVELIGIQFCTTAMATPGRHHHFTTFRERVIRITSSFCGYGKTAGDKAVLILAL